jgi:hypothetical protein
MSGLFCEVEEYVVGSLHLVDHFLGGWVGYHCCRVHLVDCGESGVLFGLAFCAYFSPFFFFFFFLFLSPFYVAVRVGAEAMLLPLS